MEAGSGHAIDHGAIAQNRQIKPIAVEGDELRLQLIDSINEAFDQFGLGPFFDMRGAESRHAPSIIFPFGHQCSDTGDAMQGMLWKARAERVTGLGLVTFLQPMSWSWKTGQGVKVYSTV